MSDPDERGLRTGEIAELAGVGASTVRYYERRGLIDPPARTPAGYRAYSSETAATIRLIKRAQDLGFTLNEIRNLLKLRANPDATDGDVRKMAEAKLRDFDRRLSRLKTNRDTLAALLGRGGDTGARAKLSTLFRYLEELSGPEW